MSKRPDPSHDHRRFVTAVEDGPATTERWHRLQIAKASLTAQSHAYALAGCWGSPWMPARWKRRMVEGRVVMVRRGGTIVLMGVPEDVYTHGHGESVLRSHRWRTAENSAGFLLPRIHEEARILDVGCGPGTISVDLARLVKRGSVVAVDRSERVIAEARAAARQADVANPDFAVGDVYALDYGAGTFDVVHAHQVLQHLSDPVAGLREMARVCKASGLVAVRDSDYAGFTWWPAVPELDEWLTLYRAVARGNGAEPDAGRRLKSWALAAGLRVVSSSAGLWCFSSPEDVAWWGGMWAERVVGSGMAEQATERGLASGDDLERLAQGWQRWATSAEAWFAVLHGELLCSPAVEARP